MADDMNLTTITLERFCREIKENIEDNFFKPFIGIGRREIGTIEGIEQIAAELGIKTKIIKLTDNIVSSLKDISSKLLPIKEKDSKRGILILDGITSVSTESRMRLCSLLDSRRSFGIYNLPDEWLVVGLGCGKNDNEYQGMEPQIFSLCISFNIDVN